MGISVGKAIRHINKEGITSNFFLLGNDSFLQHFLVEKIKLKFDQNSKINYLNLNEDSDMMLLINELQTVSMFSSKNIFVIKNFNRLTKKIKSFLEKYVQSPDMENLLIFVLDDYRINNKFLKIISDNSFLVDIQTPFYNKKIKEWVNYYLKTNEYKIEDQMINFFIDNYNDDISNIINEIEKVYLFNNKEYLSFDDYDIHYNNRHIKIWNLMDTIGQKKINESIKIYRNLLLNGVSLIPIINNLANFYIELYSSKENRYNGLNKIINSRMSSYKKKYNKDEVLNIILVLRNLDIILKSTSIDEETLFAPVICKICKGLYV